MYAYLSIPLILLDNTSGPICVTVPAVFSAKEPLSRVVESRVTETLAYDLRYRVKVARRRRGSVLVYPFWPSNIYARANKRTLS